MADKISNQRLLELIGEIDGIVLSIKLGIGPTLGGTVYLKLLGREIPILNDEGAHQTVEISRAQLADMLANILT